MACGESDLQSVQSSSGRMFELCRMTEKANIDVRGFERHCCPARPLATSLAVHNAHEPLLSLHAKLQFLECNHIPLQNTSRCRTTIFKPHVQNHQVCEF